MTSPQVKERPILFSGEMVRAILEGRKTQTRRVVKRQPDDKDQEIKFENGWLMYRRAGFGWTSDQQCRYGIPGDQLWVRENGWERPERTTKMMRDGADSWERYYYDADPLGEQDFEDFRRWGFKRRPSIHMPRWASRITLEVTGVRVQRLQDISEADTRAEGLPELVMSSRMDYGGPAQYKPSYRELWDKINGAGAWNKNPWVWVVEFKRA